MISISKPPWNVAIRAYFWQFWQPKHYNTKISWWGSNALLKGMNMEQMFADYNGRMVGSFGSPSSVFCYITRRLPSCFINLPNTAGVIMEVHWRLSCLQKTSKYKTTRVEITQLPRKKRCCEVIQEIFSVKVKVVLSIVCGVKVTFTSIVWVIWKKNWYWVKVPIMPPCKNTPLQVKVVHSKHNQQGVL